MIQARLARAPKGLHPLQELPPETPFVVLGRCGNFDDLQP
jgi:hypothetical protein